MIKISTYGVIAINSIFLHFQRFQHLPLPPPFLGDFFEGLSSSESSSLSSSRL